MGRLLKSAGYIGNVHEAFLVDGTLYTWISVSDKDGASVAPSVVGTVKVAKDGFVSEDFGAITLSAAVTGVIGLYRVTISLHADSFYVTNKDYTFYLHTSTIDGEAVNSVLFHISVDNRS